MILAGDVPMNSVVQCDGLSSSIADGAAETMKGRKLPELAILVV
jgi:hypothetical protein